MVTDKIFLAFLVLMLIGIVTIILVEIVKKKTGHSNVDAFH